MADRQVYPPKTYQLSQNFDPVGGFDARAHFICMNMQGKAASGRAKLTADVRRRLSNPNPNLDPEPEPEPDPDPDH